MKTEGLHLVVLHCDSTIGKSLLANLGKPGGAKFVFIAEPDRHPAILCTTVDVGSQAPFVVLTQPTLAGDAESSRRVLWVPSTHILLVHAIAQPSQPIGFATA